MDEFIMLDRNLAVAVLVLILILAMGFFASRK